MVLIGVAIELAAKERSDAVPRRELRRCMMAIGMRLKKIDQIMQVTLYGSFASFHSFSFRSYQFDMLRPVLLGML